jgi:multidrug efflux pump subunit AcrA (membrane-fusion protein)
MERELGHHSALSRERNEGCHADLDRVGRRYDQDPIGNGCGRATKFAPPAIAKQKGKLVSQLSQPKYLREFRGRPPERDFAGRGTCALLGRLFVVVVVALSAGCRDAPKAAAPPPPPAVKVAPVIEKDMPLSSEWVGTLVGYINAQIRPRVSGYLVSQKYREGSLVKTDDLLFEIDPRPFQNAVDGATAKLRQAESQVTQAKSQVAQAELFTALKEVSDALTVLGKLTEAETGQTRSVKALKESVEIATDRYRYGLASYYEVLEAQQQLFPAQSTLAQIRRDRLLAYVQLYKSLGGGWSLTEAQWSGQAKGSGS